jgi:hypothetical protein
MHGGKNFKTSHAVGVSVIKIWKDGENVPFSLYLTDQSKTIRPTQDEVKIGVCL